MWERRREVTRGGGSLEKPQPRRHLLKLKLVAILSSTRRNAVTMVTAGQTGGLDYPERLHRVPLTPRFIQSPADLTLKTLSGPGSSSLTEIHRPAPQTEGKKKGFFQVQIPSGSAAFWSRGNFP